MDKKVNVTIIDDDQIYVKVLSEKLGQNSKLKISQYANGEHFLADIEGKEPKILITDYYLNSQNSSAINGSELVKKLRIDYPNLAVIVVSGRADLTTASNTNELSEALEFNSSKVETLMQEGGFFYVVKDKSAPSKIYDIVESLVKKVF